jgi:glycosyltransferase involved in cell wall biosynthesis
MMVSIQAARQVLQHHTGVVIPAYLPTSIDVVQGEELLRDTVSAACAQVGHPDHICLSVDGANYGEEVAASIASELGASLAVAPENRGKLQAGMLGANRLLADPEIQYVILIDQDGDHFPNELVNFVRAALHLAESSGDERLMVLGQRHSLHRPLGWLRGELEILADRVLLSALRYHAAITGVPLALEYAEPVGEVPDFHSGYKLFSREVAAAVFDGPPVLCGLGEDGAYRHAVEAVMTVRAYLHGARLGLVHRSTFNQQPVSTFELFDRHQLTIDMIAWPCHRLGIPPAFVRQWMANVVPSLMLDTMVPEGREILDRVVEGVMATFGAHPEAATRPTSRDAGARGAPLFV